MSIETRLNRLAPVLTAKERAILVLGSLKNRTLEDPLWRSTMPASQVAEFNRLIGLMNACNIQLGVLIAHIEHVVEKMELRLMWGGTLALVADYAPKPRRRKAKLECRVMDVLPERIEEGVVAEAPGRWKELRAIEVVLDELAREFDGEYPLRDVHVEALHSVKGQIADLRELTPGFDLPEPEEDDLEWVRDAVARWAG